METRIRSVRSLEGSRPANNHLGREQRTDKTERKKARDEINGTSKLRKLSIFFPARKPKASIKQDSGR